MMEALAIWGVIAAAMVFVGTIVCLFHFIGDYCEMRYRVQNMWKDYPLDLRTRLFDLENKSAKKK